MSNAWDFYDEKARETMENTLRGAFMDIMTDYMEGKYAGVSQPALIEECYERVINAIRYQSQTPAPALSDKENKEWQK